MSTTRKYDSPKREAQAADTRRAIVEAFREQLVEERRDTLSPTDAAARAGCSVRTVHDHFPTRDSRVDALAELLDEEIYSEAVAPPTSVDDLADHYRTIHRAALRSPLATALITHTGTEWREVRVRRRADRLDAVRQVVRSIGAPDDNTNDALGVLLALAGGEITVIMRDQFGFDEERTPDAIAHTVELIVADLRASASRGTPTRDDTARATSAHRPRDSSY